MSLSSLSSLSQEQIEALKSMKDAGLTNQDIQNLHTTTTTWAPQISDTYGVNRDTFLKAAENYNTFTNQDLTPPEVVTATAQPGSGLLGLTPELNQLQDLPEETVNQLQAFNEAGLTQQDVVKASTQLGNLDQVTDFIYNSQGASGEDQRQGLLDFTRYAGTYYSTAPEVFQKWAAENPQAATLFFARVADPNIDIPVDINRDGEINKADREAAQQLAYQSGQLATGGKEHVAIDYSGDQFKDVTNEWGLGDSRKIGTTQTANDGGLIGDIVNFALPGFDAGDVLSIPGAGLAAGLLSPATGGASLAIYEALKLAEGDPITANTVMSLMPLLGSSGLFTTPGGDLDLSALGDLGGSFYDTDFEQAQQNEDNTQTPEEIGEGQDDMLDSMLSDFDRWIRNQGWDPDEWEWKPPQTGEAGGGGSDSSGSNGSTGGPGAPGPDEQVEPNQGAYGDEPYTWEHTNPDGTVVRGNEVGDVWEVQDPEEPEEPEIDWGSIFGGIIRDGTYGGIWTDIISDIFGDGTDNSGNGDTGTDTGGTGGTGTDTGDTGNGTNDQTPGDTDYGGINRDPPPGGGQDPGPGTGQDGQDGEDGEDGEDGLDGLDGAPGRPGASASGGNRVWEDFYWKINTLMPLAQRMGVPRDEFIAKMAERFK